jgi:hypothetical protein
MGRNIIALGAAALFALFWVVPSSAQIAKGITAYRESVDVGSDGSAKVTVEATVAAGSPASVDLPQSFANAKDLSISASSIGATVSGVSVGDAKMLEVQFEHAPAADVPVKISFTADKFLDWSKKPASGIYSVSYTFTNTTETNIKNYTLMMTFPAGYRMNGVTSTTPRTTGEEVVPPYDFATQDGRLVVNLRSPSVAAGRTAAIAFGFRENAGSPWMAILIGLVIAAFGIYLKRDVLTREDFQKDAVA